MAHRAHDGKDDDEEQENQHFQRIVNAFRYYRTHSLKRVAAAEKSYNDLPVHHKKFIPAYPEHLQNVRAAIDNNYKIIKLIIDNTDRMFENKDHAPIDDTVIPATEFDMDKVRTTLKQFVRDWSPEGRKERETCYDPVLEEILELFSPDKCNIEDISVLVPGAGLGRLAYEIARMGYTCQGNEFSLFMLFASNFILNKCKEPEAFIIHPWVHQYCNNTTGADQVHPATFPDTNPSDLPTNSQFSMAAGDFLEVYTEPESWDCIATVFFIDTAHNIISYIETIWNILKPGGYWINHGPLLYHFADMPNESSIELSYDTVKDVILRFGFKFLKERTGIPTGYTQNERSMLQYRYNSVFFVVCKPVVLSR